MLKSFLHNKDKALLVTACITYGGCSAKTKHIAFIIFGFNQKVGAQKPSQVIHTNRCPQLKKT